MWRWISTKMGAGVVSQQELYQLFEFENYPSESNGDESTVTTEEDEDAVFSGGNPPSSPETSRSFYFVKQYPCDDAEIRAKIEEAHDEIYRCNFSRIQISNDLKAKRAERSALIVQIKNLKSQGEGKEMELKYIQTSYTMTFESNTVEEKKKQLVKQMVQDKRENIISNFEIKEKCHNSFRRKQIVMDQIKSMEMNLKNGEEVAEKIDVLSEELMNIKMEINSMETVLAHVLEKRDRAFELIKMLRRKRDLMNAAFIKSCSVMIRARNLAAIGHVKELEGLSNAEVKKFMTDWNNEDDKCFRDDYVKRLSHSLDERQLSRDGRLRCSEETFDVRRKDLNFPNRNVGKATGKGCKKKDSAEESEFEDWDVPKRRKEEEEDIDEEALKVKKRQEQIEKARQAMERRKKLQEKAATKAAIRAQKEAEKKLKEQEKKAKKKETNATELECSPDKDETAAEVAKTDLTKAKSCTTEKPLVIPKHISSRQRRGRGGINTVPKSTMKRQKCIYYWATPFMVLLTIFVLIVLKGVALCQLNQLDCFSV